jgi:hypothetical protein
MLFARLNLLAKNFLRPYAFEMAFLAHRIFDLPSLQGEVRDIFPW